MQFWKPLAVCAMIAAATPAFAQSLADGQSDFDLDALPVLSEAEVAAIFGARVISEEATPVQGEDVSIYVVEDNEAKPEAAWTDADTKRCEASNGIVLPISSGRIACFAL